VLAIAEARRRDAKIVEIFRITTNTTCMIQDILI
jgi:hypothetical protein